MTIYPFVYIKTFSLLSTLFFVSTYAVEARIQYATSSNVLNYNNSRIVGGTVTNASNFRSFGISAGSTLCGATLIHFDIMLTAAHCKGYFSSGVMIGGTDVYGKSAEFIPVAQEIPHPKYNRTYIRNDIMLLKLSKGSNAPPIALNFNSTFPAKDKLVKTIGFGATKEGGSISKELREVTVKVLDFQLCSKFWSTFGLQESTTICAGNLLGGQDSCQGDSGGPLLTLNGKRQVGIVSFSYGCARSNVPPVYTRVSGYKDFIRATICKVSVKKPSYCTTR